jgi:transposase
LSWLESFGAVQCVGVEGTGCYGAGLTRLLRREQVSVLEVNRPTGGCDARGKSDPLDAENAARRALAASDTAVPKDTTTIVEAIRALRIARGGAVKARTAALNQLKDLITTAPDPLRAGLRGKTLRAPEPPEGRGQPRQRRRGRLASGITALRGRNVVTTCLRRSTDSGER